MATGVMIGIIAAVVLVAFAAAAVFCRTQSRIYRDSMQRQEQDCAGRIEALKSEHERSLQSCREGYERVLAGQKDGYERSMTELKASHEAALKDMRLNYDNSLKEIKDNYGKSLGEQIKAVRSEMTARTEEILKAREEELSKKAAETFRTITGDLTKDLQDMKKSFNESRTAQLESSTDMKARIEMAVKHLKEQTENIGSKADSLAQALRGQNKMQGCWGETLLENMLQSEGFVEGRDYDREETLKGELGEHILNEASGRKMRPDFIIHYPDSTDIIIDSKVDLKAFSDYGSAATEQEKTDAARRNLSAIRAQIDSLSKKDYSAYLLPGRKNLGYVLMFIPVYGSLQLAKSLDPDIWRDAFSRRVLITTEETLIPFLRMIRTAWISSDQVKNQKQIIASAQNMIDRVYDFVKYHRTMGEKLQDVQKYYEKCDVKIKDSGQSILTSARQIVALGVQEKPEKKISDISSPPALE